MIQIPNRQQLRAKTGTCSPRSGRWREWAGGWGWRRSWSWQQPDHQVLNLGVSARPRLSGRPSELGKSLSCRGCLRALWWNFGRWWRLRRCCHEKWAKSWSCRSWLKESVVFEQSFAPLDLLLDDSGVVGEPVPLELVSDPPLEVILVGELKRSTVTK